MIPFSLFNALLKFLFAPSGWGFAPPAICRKSHLLEIERYRRLAAAGERETLRGE